MARRGLITNTDRRSFDVVEITNEMPFNRIGGVGSVIDALRSGFAELGVDSLWFVTDHEYQPFEIDELLARYPSVAVGSYADLAQFSAPVVHLHSYYPNPELVTYLRSTRSLFTVHSLLAYEQTSNDVDLEPMVQGQEAMIRACNEVVLVSEAEHRYYHRLGYTKLNPRVRVVHNGVRARGRNRQRRGRRVLGYCGRLVPRKHPEYVQMVLREPGFETATALVAGKAFSRYARDLVRRFGIQERVRYLGWCGGARLDAFFDAIDVLVVPSSYEPFGLAALEAAARGIPVVCTRVDGLVEVMGEHAFYCDGTDYEDFHEAMRRWLACDDAALAAMTAAAAARHLAAFTDVAMARRYVERFAALSDSRAGEVIRA